MSAKNMSTDQPDFKETPTVEKREVYYELYADGQLVIEGTYEDKTDSIYNYMLALGGDADGGAELHD